jgi:hypothetical protein
MTPEELDMWARRELPPYSRKNVDKEYAASCRSFIIDAADSKTNDINSITVMRKCKCTVCKGGILEIAKSIAEKEARGKAIAATLHDLT